MGQALAESCSWGACKNKPRMAVTTSRPDQDTVWTRVWWDDRGAPKTAMRYCRSHGAQLLTSLAETLTHEDEPKG